MLCLTFEPQTAKNLADKLKRAEMTEFAANGYLHSVRPIAAWYTQKPMPIQAFLLSSALHSLQGFAPHGFRHPEVRKKPCSDAHAAVQPEREGFTQEVRERSQ